MKYFSQNVEVKKIQTNFSKLNQWVKLKNSNSLVLFRGYAHNFSKKDLLIKATKLNVNNVSRFLNSIDGHFCLIVIKENFAFAAVDKIRSIPIIYTIQKKKLILSDHGTGISKIINLKPKDIDLFSSKLFALSGYSFNQNTLYKNIKQINPGSYLIIYKSKIIQKNYYLWRTWNLSKAGKKLQKLKLLNEKIIKKLLKSCNGRQIVIPLSGGLDSRFIASGLKHFGYTNVVCVSYGIKGNKDSLIAKKVSKKLSFKWIYVKYTSKKFKDAFYSDDYQKYLNYCDSFTSIHFAGEYLMLKSLKKNNLIDRNAIIVNGQSGDFISGNHIPKNLPKNVLNLKNRVYNISNEYTKNHYKHWKSLIDDNLYKAVFTYVNEMVKQLGGLPKNANEDFSVVEYIEFINRQSKYVINGQRNYEYFNFDWRLPLWDDEYLKFWATANYSEKINQNLYVKALFDTNWGDVWNNIDINPLIIAPRWIIPIRLLAKFIFIPFGKKKWHLFERKFLDYFMTSTSCYGPWSYKKIITDNRGHHSPIGWLIEDYLKNKGINWKGEIH